MYLISEGGGVTPPPPASSGGTVLPPPILSPTLPPSGTGGGAGSGTGGGTSQPAQTDGQQTESNAGEPAADTSLPFDNLLRQLREFSGDDRLVDQPWEAFVTVGAGAFLTFVRGSQWQQQEGTPIQQVQQLFATAAGVGLGLVAADEASDIRYVAGVNELTLAAITPPYGNPDVNVNAEVLITEYEAATQEQLLAAGVSPEEIAGLRGETFEETLLNYAEALAHQDYENGILPLLQGAGYSPDEIDQMRGATFEETWVNYTQALEQRGVAPYVQAPQSGSTYATNYEQLIRVATTIGTSPEVTSQSLPLSTAVLPWVNHQFGINTDDVGQAELLIRSEIRYNVALLDLNPNGLDLDAVPIALLIAWYEQQLAQLQRSMHPDSDEREAIDPYNFRNYVTVQSRQVAVAPLVYAAYSTLPMDDVGAFMDVYGFSEEQDARQYLIGQLGALNSYNLDASWYEQSTLSLIRDWRRELNNIATSSYNLQGDYSIGFYLPGGGGQGAPIPLDFQVANLQLLEGTYVGPDTALLMLTFSIVTMGLDPIVTGVELLNEVQTENWGGAALIFGLGFLPDLVEEGTNLARRGGRAVARRTTLGQVVDVVDITADQYLHFYTRADPFREVLGPAYDSAQYGAEVSEMIRVMERSGVEIRYQTGRMGYSSRLSATSPHPPQFTIDLEASIGAWRHEYKHFLDDRSYGFLPYSSYAQEPHFEWNWELRAYTVEIELARSLNLPDVEEQLIQNMIERKTALGFDNVNYQSILQELPPR